MSLRFLPLLLLAAFGLAIAGELDYPLDAPAPDGRREGVQLRLPGRPAQPRRGPEAQLRGVEPQGTCHGIEHLGGGVLEPALELGEVLR